MTIPDEALRAIDSREALYAFLRDRLQWPVDPEDTFAYAGPPLPGALGARARVEQIIPFSAGDPFAIMLVEFETEFRRGDLREILRAIRAHDRTMASYAGRKPDEFVFVCAEKEYAGIRMAHFEQREGRQPKLRVFGWQRGEHDGSPLQGTRTIREFNLPQLVMPAARANTEGSPLQAPDWDEGRDRWMAAWDVEKVTREFYHDYERVFHAVEGLITGVKGDKRLFTQRLFNRLLFVHFLSKKKWLRFHGRTDYLHALWEEGQGSNFYNVHLRPLFFGALNNPEARNLMRRNPEIAAFVGDVPFLNGGLFEQAPDECQGETVPDEAFALILDLFGRYNFTVTESTPDDVEVAVDPEMLGKVFEELVTGRHETGSYYTPRPVVAFMCREALKGYLAPQPPSLPPDTAPAPGKGESDASAEAIAALVDQHDGSAIYLAQAKRLLHRLEAIRVVDPACGSGAYLLGMLHELHALTRVLDTRAEQATARDDYKRKLQIIQRNLYGVDLDTFAMNTARLRLWLSLAVEHEGTDPEPLPNLDFKIEQGDSLTGPNPQASATGFRGELIGQYEKAKERYADPYFRGNKTALRAEIDELRDAIASFTHPGEKAVGFDWRVEFAEVFSRPEAPGFDVVLANPPYVRADAQFRHITDERQRHAEIAAWQAYRSSLVRSQLYRTLYERWDLFMPFLERAHQLLHPSGHMVFIISDAYNASKYTARSHEFFIAHSQVHRVDFCTDIPLFTAAVRNTIVHFERGTAPDQHTVTRVRRWGETADDFDANCERLPGLAQAAGQGVFRSDTSDTKRPAGAVIPLEMICYISYGLRANADERYWRGEFVTADLVSDHRDRKHPKPFIEGKDIVRWAVRRIRYLEWGTERAPGRFARPTFPELHEAKGKLIALVVASGGPPVVLDRDGLFTTHTSCIFVPWHLLAGVVNRSIDKTAKYSWQTPKGERDDRQNVSRQFDVRFLLAILNSGFAEEWLASRRRSDIHVYPDDWKPLPVPVATPEQQGEISALVDRVLALYEEHGYPLPAEAAERLAELEREIDDRVAALYGL